MQFSYELYLALCHYGLGYGQQGLINRDALFSDGTSCFRTPSEPEPGDLVRFRIRTAKQPFDQVSLILNGEKLTLHKTVSDTYFDYYETERVLQNCLYHYYFELRMQTDVCYYFNIGPVDRIYPEYEFHVTPGFHTPDWAKGAVFYQIFVDRFCNGDTSNDVKDNEYIYIGEGTHKVSKWQKYPESMDVREFYGGDLLGVMKKLDYLKDLGVKVIYLNPIFVSPSNHKYDIQDYDYVDPHIGRIVKEYKKPQKKNAESDRVQGQAISLDLEHSQETISQTVSACGIDGDNVKDSIENENGGNGIFNLLNRFTRSLKNDGASEREDKEARTEKNEGEDSFLVSSADQSAGNGLTESGRNAVSSELRMEEVKPQEEIMVEAQSLESAVTKEEEYDEDAIPKENRNARKYITRVTDKENLEASNQLFIQLVEEIHKRGMKVILDGVFNHCGSFNKWMDKERIYEKSEGYQPGAYVSKDSPYRSYFDFKNEDWPYNDSYEGWWGHDTLPKLNYEASPQLYNYVMEIARKWVSPPYNADGWRLDVAADLGHSENFNHKFWRDFRENVRKAKPDALIVAEHYGDASAWLKGDQWDTVMNYDAFMEPISWFVTGMEKHSDEYHPDLIGNHDFFLCSMKHFMSRFQQQSLQVAMNELSNHDHSRFLTRTNHTVGRTQSHGPQAAGENLNYGLFRIAVVMQFTWPGAPTIYYGDEAGVCGWTDPDNRRTYPWGNEDKELIRFHKELAAIHNSYDAFLKGSFEFLNCENQVITYGRFDDTDKIVIGVNVCGQEKKIAIDVWRIGITKEDRLYRMMETTAQGIDLSAQPYETHKGILSLVLKPYSSVIIKNYAAYGRGKKESRESTNN